MRPSLKVILVFSCLLVGSVAQAADEDLRLDEGQAKGVLAALADEHAGVKVKAMGLLANQEELPKGAVATLVKLLRGEDGDVRRAAARALGVQKELPRDTIDALAKLLNDKEREIRSAAALSLGRQEELPKDVAAALAKLLRDNDGDVRSAAAAALERQKKLPQDAAVVVELLRDVDRNVRSDAARALGGKKELPRGAIDALVKLLDAKEGYVRSAAAGALWRQEELPQSAVDALVKLLRDTDGDVRSAAEDVLGRQKELPKGTVDALIKLLRDKDGGVRYASARLLERRKELPGYSDADLFKLLQDEDRAVRSAAARALGGQKELPRGAAAALVDLLRDKDSDVRSAAAGALGDKKELPRGAIDALVKLLDAKEGYIRSAAALVLGGQQELPRGAVDALVKLLRGEDRAFRAVAARALGGQKELSKDAAAALVKLLHEDRAVRDAAARALERQKLPQGAVDALVKLLRDKDPDVRRAAARVLGEQKELPKDAVHPLIELLEAGDSDVPSAAEDTLKRQEELPKDAVAALVKLLRHKDPDVRSAAARVLQRQKELSKGAVATLIKLLRDEGGDVRRAAARALGGQKDLPKDAVDALAKLLNDKERGVRSAAAVSLGRQEELPKDVAAALAKLLRDEDHFVRAAAAAALGAQKGLPKDVATALAKLIHDKDRDVRSAAAGALERQKELPEEVIAPLVKLLEDKEAHVRSTAEKLLLKSRPSSIVLFLEIPYANTPLLSEARWLAHYWGRGEQQNELLCDYLGRPKSLANKPATARGTRNLLRALGDAFDRSSSPWLQEDAALWAGYLFTHSGVAWNQEDKRLVQEWVKRLQQKTNDVRLAAHLPEIRRILDRLEDRYLTFRSIALALSLGLVALVALLVIPANWTQAKEWVPMLTFLGGATWKVVDPSLGSLALDRWVMIWTLVVFVTAIVAWGVHSPMFLRHLAKLAPFNFFILELAHLLPWARRRIYAAVQADTARKSGRINDDPSAGPDDPLYHPLPAWNRSRGDDEDTVINQPAQDIVQLLSNPVGRRGHVLIQAPGGLGKTTLLNKVVRRLLEEYHRAPTGKPLPVFLAAEGDSIEERLKKGLGEKALIAPEQLATFLRRGWFVLVADNVGDTGLNGKAIAGYHGTYHHHSPLLLCGRDQEAIKDAIRNSTPDALVVEPSLLTDQTLDGFVEHCVKHLSGKPLAGPLRDACRGANGYVPLLVRLAVTLPGDSAAASRVDIFREYLFRQCKCEKTEEPSLLQEVAQLARTTFWESGKREFIFAVQSPLQRRLLEARILVPHGKGGARFFHDSVCAYLTAEALLQEDLIDYRNLPRPAELPNTPWDRSRVLFWMAGRPEFAALQSDEVSELFDTFLTLFVSQSEDPCTRLRLLRQIRALLKEELLAIEERFRPFRKGVPHHLGDPQALLPLVPNALPAKGQLALGDTRTLLTTAAEECSQEDERKGDVSLLKHLYANLARRVFDRCLASDRRADKEIARKAKQNSQPAASTEPVAG